MVLVLKNLPANAGDIRNMGLIPGSGSSPGGEHGAHPSILAWRIPWTQETKGCSPWGHKESDTTKEFHSLIHCAWVRSLTLFSGQ